MSRAFVKEDDATIEVVAPRPQRQHPRYVTPEGMEQLRARLSEAQAAGNEREVEEAQSRLDEAVVVEPREQDSSRIAFGASVTVEQPDRKRVTYRIVGEDEADPLNGSISWLSPLAQALLDRAPGDRVVWERPAGNVAIKIVSVAYA